MMTISFAMALKIAITFALSPGTFSNTGHIVFSVLLVLLTSCYAIQLINITLLAFLPLYHLFFFKMHVIIKITLDIECH